MVKSKRKRIRITGTMKRQQLLRWVAGRPNSPFPSIFLYFIIHFSPFLYSTIHFSIIYQYILLYIFLNLLSIFVSLLIYFSQSTIYLSSLLIYFWFTIYFPYVPIVYILLIYSPIYSYLLIYIKIYDIIKEKW